MPDGSRSHAMHTSFRSEPPPALSSQVAEHSLLGALLIKPEIAESLPDDFRPDHYAWPDHKEIHDAIIAYGTPGASAVVAVMQAWALNDPDRRAYITQLFTLGPLAFHPASVRADARVITDLYRRREIVAVSERMREGAFANAAEESSEATIARAMNSLDLLTSSAPDSKRASSLDEAMDAAMRAADDAARRGGPAGLPTGFAALDQALGGLEEGTLTVLGGRPAMGKSALGWQVAINIARLGVGVLVISLEMSATELGRRALAALSGVPIWRMKRGKMQPGDADALIAARKELAGLPLTIEDGGGLTAAGIGLKARAAQRRHGLSLVMVDHLHIVRPEDADAKHGGTWAVGRISGAMKRLAKEYRCPVLLLAQLNRAVEGRDDKRPNLSDLRQSGDIEQDADAVAFVYRAEYYLAKEPDRVPSETEERFAKKMSDWRAAKHAASGKAELILAKVRDGALDTINLTFHAETTSFAEAHTHEQ